MRVEGHTDSRASDAHNLDLSRRRAASVMRYLTEQGVDATRLDSEGFGESRPIADNETEEGRALNRRVEFDDHRAGRLPRPTDGAVADDTTGGAQPSRGFSRAARRPNSG